VIPLLDTQHDIQFILAKRDMSNLLLSRVTVTKTRVWISTWFYWIFIDRNYK
jgi:hypothetical protein